jgi:hypothetical protein
MFVSGAAPSVPLISISFWLNDRCVTPSLLIDLVNWYNQKPFIGLVRAGQMYDACAVPPTASETLQIFWMRSQHHNVGSDMKLPAGRARHPLTHIHVGNAKSIDVLRSAFQAILYPLKENSIETSRVVMLGAGWWPRHAGPFTRTLTENSKFAALAGRMIHNSRAVGYEVWSGPQCVRNFLSVCYRQVFSCALSACCERSEKTKYS